MNNDRPAFEAAARAAGFDQILERQWGANVEIATHTHCYAVRAVVLQGQMWLTVGSGTRHLLPGDSFELEREVPHAERYGPEGASYLVARRHA